MIAEATLSAPPFESYYDELRNLQAVLENVSDAFQITAADIKDQSVVERTVHKIMNIRALSIDLLIEEMNRGVEKLRATATHDPNLSDSPASVPLAERHGDRDVSSTTSEGDVLHLVAPTAGSQPDSLAASAHWPDGTEVTSEEYEGYKLWIADGTPDGWLRYRLMHQAGTPAAAHDQGASDEGESERARREQDEAGEEPQ